MSKTHWLKNPNKNYLGHWDLPDGKNLILTVKSANWETVTNPTTNKTEEKRIIRFKENFKPMICNQTNAKNFIFATGVKYMEDAPGKRIELTIDTIYSQQDRSNVDCIRIVPKPVKESKGPVTLKIGTKEFDSVLKFITDPNQSESKFEDLMVRISKRYKIPADTKKELKSKFESKK